MSAAALISFFLLLISGVNRKLRQGYGLAALLFGMGLSYFHAAPLYSSTRILAQAALIFFLFIDGVRLHFPKVIHYQREAFRLATLGFLIQVLLGALLAHFLIELSLAQSFLLSLALSATDLKSTPITLRIFPTRISQMLSTESSMTTLFALFLFMTIKEANFYAIFIPLCLGAILGFTTTFFAKFSLRRKFASRPFLAGSLFIAPFALFFFLESLGWNGYIGVIALALTLGHFGRSFCAELFDLARNQGKILYLLFLILFGSQVIPALTYSLSLQPILYSMLALFAARLLAAFSSSFKWKTSLFASFLGPRILVPAALALLFLPEASLYIATMISLLVHSLLAFPLSKAYGHALFSEPYSPEHVPTVALPLPSE